MQITNNKINFGTNIKYVSNSGLKRIISMLPEKPEFVDYPWTIESLKKSESNIITDSIANCIAGLITNGEENLMFHLMTRNKEEAKLAKVKFFDIKNIEKHLKQSINLKGNGIHAIILGGLKSLDYRVSNQECFEEIIELFNKYKTPCSIIGPRKDIPARGFGCYSMLYTKSDDTLWISEDGTTSPWYGKNEIRVTKGGISYNLYETIIDPKNINTFWNSEIVERRVKTGTEDFLKSRFEKVTLCKYDNFA